MARVVLTLAMTRFASIRRVWIIPLVILADQALEIGAIAKSSSDPDRASASWLNHDAVGVAEGWLREQRNSYSVTL
jgi:hypothetical protein